MTEVHRVPARLRAEDLSAILREIADGFDGGDTLEGNISFSIAMPPEDAPLPDGYRPEWDVVATYRVGNLRGQGFTRMIGTLQ